MANAVNSVIWFIILIVFGFVVAGFCAGLYLLLSPFAACIPDLKEFTDCLLRGVQFAYFCAHNMMNGVEVGEIGNAFKEKPIFSF
jgi:hypothetical protein